MIEFVDPQSDCQAPEAEYVRLLGYPAGWTLEGRAKELANWARAWYAMHGQPWTYACCVETIDVGRECVTIGREPFSSRYLSRCWSDAGAHAAVLAAVSAGPELERETNRLWQDEKPDEYFFLEILGSAIVEHLITETGSQICAWAQQEGMAVLPHYSPGYRQWDVAEQSRLLRLIRQQAGGPLPGDLSVLNSGMLQPKKSQLAVFGVTRHVGRVERSPELVPCACCTYAPCQYRRSPYVLAVNRYGETTMVFSGSRHGYDRIVSTPPLGAP